MIRGVKKLLFAVLRDIVDIANEVADSGRFDLRRLFSALVAGNVKESGIRQIAARGPFEIHGDRRLVEPLDALLAQFVAQNRMKLSGEYKPIYRIVA